MSTAGQVLPLGHTLANLRSWAFGVYMSIGEGLQLANEAFSIVSKQVAESKLDEITIHYPIGVDVHGNVMQSSPKKWKPPDLSRRFAQMRDVDLPVAVLYQLVTTTEAWQQHVLRAVLRHFPQKLGGSKQVPISLVLSATSIEAAHIAATDAFLHELSYKSPADYAEIASKLLSITIVDIPAFWKYLESKATRDIWIHNMGIANDIYLTKAGSHARVKAGQILPVSSNYVLQCYEQCLQLLEEVHSRLAALWPGPPEPEAPLFTATPGQAGPSAAPSKPPADPSNPKE